MDEEAGAGKSAPPPGRSGIGIAMLAVAALLFVAAALFVVVAVRADSAASDDRHATARANASAAALEAQAWNAKSASDHLVTNVSTARGYLFGARDRAVDFAKATNQFNDAYGHGAMLHNQGDVAAGSVVFTTDVISALTDMDAKSAALQTEIQDADAAIQKVAASTR
jgi:hypothetical protein